MQTLMAQGRAKNGMSRQCAVRRRAAWYAVCLSLFISLFLPARADTISVAVAANVQYVFDDLRRAFKAESGHDLQPIFNSSGKLSAQILLGAPFDVFLSADMDLPERLYAEGKAVARPRMYAQGLLVLWSTRDIDLTHWQSLLTDAKIKRIALANPRLAPYGEQSMKLLETVQLDQKIKSKLLFGESIAQTNQYIYSGVADLGFTAKSVVLSKEMAEQGKWINLPLEAYQPIEQGIVVLSYGQQHHRRAAQAFYQFMFGAKARAILTQAGYGVP